MKGCTNAANEVVNEGLRLLEADVKKPHLNRKNRYDAFGLAVMLGEGIEDARMIERYKIRRSKELGLGFVADIYDVMGRDES